MVWLPPWHQLVPRDIKSYEDATAMSCQQVMLATRVTKQGWLYKSPSRKEA